MKSKRRVVIDTNVLVSAVLIENSRPKQALEKILASDKLLISTPALTELVEVFQRSKFDRYVRRERRQALLALISQYGEIVNITVSLAVCRDPKDNQLLELAVSGQADYLVTGDADLLVLNPFQNIQILTAEMFLMLQ